MLEPLEAAAAPGGRERLERSVRTCRMLGLKDDRTLVGTATDTGHLPKGSTVVSTAHCESLTGVRQPAGMTDATTTSRRRILVCCFGSRGDVQPHAALARGLQDAGWKVLALVGEVCVCPLARSDVFFFLTSVLIASGRPDECQGRRVDL